MAAKAREVRKVVTVVFCDLTGSTELGEQLDPEPLRALLDWYFATMSEVLVRHGGTVEKFIGDAVVAVFGVPVLHEDDALRAVRAAMEMISAMERLTAEMKQRWGVSPGVRVGVNTGEVLTGDAAGRGRLATGDAVNVAARLEQAALPGQVVVGRDTYRLVRDAVRAQALPPMRLKGKSEPVASYVVHEALSGADGYARPLNALFVGREAELDILRRSYDDAVSAGTCRRTLVVQIHRCQQSCRRRAKVEARS
jgi:class 3 adenylate cyclase